MNIHDINENIISDYDNGVSPTPPYRGGSSCTVKTCVYTPKNEINYNS